MRTILDFNSGWTFFKNCNTPFTEIPDDGEPVSLPHTWNAEDGQNGGNDYFRGNCCYAKFLKSSDLPEKEAYYLEFHGANSSATVYVNGELIARHDGGYSTWRANITGSLKEENVISVIVDNSPNDAVYPQMADFTFYGGLYRDVRLIAVDGTHFDLDYFGSPGIAITTKKLGTDAELEIDAYVTNLQPKDQIRYTILNRNGVVITESVETDTSAHLKITDVHRWHGKKDPYLYTAKATILRDGSELDEVSARFGCRAFAVDPERGFLLNGEEYPLRGVSRHQDWLGIGNALTKKHHEKDMDLICELGATTVRLAHYQQDSYFYDLCDERGIVVWAEIPYISRHVATAKENTVSQLKELIIQNYNHPSIVVWGISNEITMSGADDPDLIQHHKTLQNLVRELDRSRLTTVACLTMCNIDAEYVHIPDLVAYNHYFGWYGGDTSMNGPWFDRFHEKYPNKPIGVSEYGCEALNWHTSTPKQGDYTEEYQAYYHEELIKQLYTRPYLWATYVWNMFDFGADARAEGGENGQNHKGLITMDRNYKKDSFFAYKAWLSDEPFVHLCGKRYIDRTEDMTEITVYSNLPQVELFANGKSIGKQKSDCHFFRFNVKNEGETELQAVAGSCRDESRIRKVSEPNPDYILKENGTVLNWFDITAPEGRFSLNDTLSDILKTEQGQIWFAQMGKQIQNALKGNEQNAIMMNEDMMKMLGGFTVLRLASLMSTMNVTFTKEQLLELNRELNKISKS